MATIKKACKGTLYPKSSSVSRKLKSGGDLGMKSVKAGFDKNPGVTRADIIVAAKGQAKKGMKVKKAQFGLTSPAPKQKESYSKFIGPVQRPMKMQPIKTQKEKEKEAEMMKKATPPKSKTGKMLKKQAAVAIAMKKAGKKPKAMMKMGGKTKKCAYGCK